MHPEVTLENGASLRDYRLFIVGPVIDESGYPFSLPVTDSLQMRLAKRLKSHGLLIQPPVPSIDTMAAALIITSTLTSFRSSSFVLQLPAPGVSECSLRSVLTDGRTGQKIGEIVANDLEEDSTPLWVLLGCANRMADAIAKAVLKG